MTIGITIIVAYLWIGLLLTNRRVENIAVADIDIGTVAAAFRMIATWPLWAGRR